MRDRCHWIVVDNEKRLDWIGLDWIGCDTNRVCIATRRAGSGRGRGWTIRWRMDGGAAAAAAAAAWTGGVARARARSVCLAQFDFSRRAKRRDAERRLRGLIVEDASCV